jgi:hypothetical protein
MVYVCLHMCDSLLDLQHADVGSYVYGINSEHKQQHARFMCVGFHFNNRPPAVPISIVFSLQSPSEFDCAVRYIDRQCFHFQSEFYSRG